MEPANQSIGASPMIEVELPDGRLIEFPDGTAPDVMQRVTAEAAQQRTAPVGAGQAAMFGAMDPVHGGAQALVSNLPSGVVDVVNRETAAVNEMPVIGPITRGLGMTPRTPEQLNAEVVSRERNF